MVDVTLPSCILRHMPKRQEEPLDLKFQALADSTRRAVVERLVRAPASASELAKPFAMALPSFHQHLGVLERAGIVTSQKVGRVRTYQLAPDALADCGSWIGKQRLPAERQLDRLGHYLEETTNKEH